MKEEYYFVTFLGYLIVINLVGFYSMWSDKQKAKKGTWRTPEKTLILIAVLGGSIGSLTGMKKFRHKTKHAKFYIGIPVILVMQIIFAVWYIMTGAYGVFF